MVRSFGWDQDRHAAWQSLLTLNCPSLDPEIRSEFNWKLNHLADRIVSKHDEAAAARCALSCRKDRLQTLPSDRLAVGKGVIERAGAGNASSADCTTPMCGSPRHPAFVTESQTNVVLMTREGCDLVHSESARPNVDYLEPQ
jgi:hypothetical protein